MRLRNKKTGEIVETDRGYLSVPSSSYHTYHSLAELNEDWEDYEEPKDFWFIDDEGGVECGVIEFEENLNLMQAIGNYFETKEEAELAIDKLKALKRLKDAGVVCVVTDRDYRDKYFSVRFKIKNPRVYQEEDSYNETDDIMLVFCGK